MSKIIFEVHLYKFKNDDITLTENSAAAAVFRATLVVS